MDKKEIWTYSEQKSLHAQKKYTTTSFQVLNILNLEQKESLKQIYNNIFPDIQRILDGSIVPWEKFNLLNKYLKMCTNNRLSLQLSLVSAGRNSKIYIIPLLHGEKIMTENEAWMFLWNIVVRNQVKFSGEYDNGIDNIFATPYFTTALQNTLNMLREKLD